ncbi:hypothetical protein GCM10010975_04590 [Comamonas phosphati]|nr:hypothetical protein GCM10010975_04590 [Comamonas phosphati]
MPALPAPPGHHCCIHIDGSALPNPGPMSLGAVLRLPDGARHTLSRNLRRSGCNNEAELLALIAALREAQALGVHHITLRTDSSVLVEQLGGPGPRPTRPILRLEPLFAQARRLMGEFEEIRLQWIPRHRNQEADTLARAAHAQP